MKKLLSIAALLLTVIVVKADPTTSPYQINDQQVSDLFAQSKDVSVQLFSPENASVLLNDISSSTAATSMAATTTSKNFVTAILLNFFLGGLGIHRLYLGTKTMTWVGYILTCGGIFGIVPLVDFIVLIIHNQDISPYVNNPKFFMWGNSLQ
jgi:TM2 domain-containing membrane protein YozV